MSNTKFRFTQPGSPRAALIITLVAALAFPPWAFGDAITWNGGTGNYSDPGNWTCGTCATSTYPDNGNIPGMANATINTGADTVTLDVTSIVNSMAVGGSGGSSLLNVTGGNSLTFGTPSVTTGNALAIGNGGVLNVYSGSAILDLSGGATALNDVGGQINITDGGTLTLKNTVGGTSTVTNNGSLNVGGTSTAGILQTNNAGSGAAFSVSGPGTVSVSGLGKIAVVDGNSLTIGSTLTNWNGGTLTGGSYSVGNGATLQLSGIGANNTIQTLSGANVSVTGSGLLTGDGTTNALTGLNSIYSGVSSSASLSLNALSAPLTLTPGNLTVQSDDAGSGGNGTAGLSLSGSTATIGGALNNYANTGANSGGASSVVSLGGSSSLTVNNLTNSVANNGNFGGGATAQVNLTGASSLAVNTDVANLNSNNNGFFGGASAGISLAGGSSLTVGGSFTNADSFQPGGHQSSSSSLTLSGNSTAVVTGLFSNGNFSPVTLNASSLTTNGGFSNLGSVSLTNSSTLTDAGFTNTNGYLSLTGSQLNETGAFSNSSSFTLANGSTGTIAGTLTNTSNGYVGISASTLNTNGGISNAGQFNLASGGILNDTGFAGNGGLIYMDSGTFNETGAYTSSGLLTLVNSSTATVTGALTNSSGGLIQVTSSQVNANGGLSNAGQIVVNAGTLNASSFSNTSSVGLSGGGTLAVTGTLSNSGTGVITTDGTGNTITAAAFTNVGGYVIAGATDTLDFRNGGTGQLLDLSAGTLTGGAYNLGGNLFYSTGGDSSSTYIHGLNGASIALNGSGAILFGANGGTNALTQLTSLTGSNLSLTGSSLSLSGPLSNTSESAISLSAGSSTSTLAVAGLVTNDATSSITLSGGGNTLTGQGLNNQGYLEVDAGDTADFRNGGAGQLTGLTGGTLSGGTYNLSGQLFYDTGSDGSHYINSLDNSTVTLSGSGAFLFGANAGTDALALNSIVDGSALLLNGQTRIFNPATGTFTVDSASLGLVNSSALTIQGALQSGNGNVSVDSSSSLTVQGGLANFAGGTLTGGNYNLAGTLQFDTNGASSDYIQTLSGVSMAINGGALLFGSGAGTNALSELSTLDNSTLTLNNQNFIINPNGNNSAFTLDPSTLTLNGSSLVIEGAVNNTSGSAIDLNYSGSASLLNIIGPLSNDATSSITLSGGGNLITATSLSNAGTISIGDSDAIDVRNGGAGVFSNLTANTLSGGGTYNLTGSLLYDTGTDGSTDIHTLSNVTATLNGEGGFFYGSSPTDALGQLGSLTNGTSLTLNDQGRIFNPAASNGTFGISASTLTLGSSNITFGDPSVTSGNVLSITSGGILNVNSGSTAVLELSGGSTALNDTGSQINVNDGGSLVLQATNGNNAVITNNGNINITGTSAGASLGLFDGSSGSTFTLSGTGTLTLAGSAQITGMSGDESLVNDVGHTIAGSGLIQNLSLTNNGTIEAVSGGNMVIDITSTLGFTNGSTGNLNVDDGGTLTVRNSSFGNNATIQNSGNINLNGSTAPTSLLFDNSGAGGVPSTFTLSGNGTLTMSNNANNLIAGVSGNENLVNDVDHTIQGSGTISNFSTFTNNGTLNANESLGVTIDLTHNSSWNGQDSFVNNGSVNVTGGSALTLLSNEGAGIQNSGTINLGSSGATPTAGSLILNDNTNGATFDFYGGGSVQMTNNAANAISGFNGTEFLINDIDHTIAGAGTISNLAGFYNYGTLQSSYAGGKLIVANSANQDNWNGTDTLYDGTYIANTGSTLQLSSIGSSQIQTLSGATVILNGTGLLTGDGSTNAAAGISTVYSGNIYGQAGLTLNSVPGTVALATANGAFTVAADDQNEEQYGTAALQLSGTKAVVAGDLVNQANTFNYGNAVSLVNLGAGSALTVNNFVNSATVSSYQGFDGAASFLNVTGGSTLTVNGNLSNTSIQANNSFGTAEATIVLDGGSALTVQGTLTNDSGGQTGYSSMNLTNNSTAVVTGLLSNLGGSLITLDQTGTGGSSLTTNGGVTNYNSEVDLFLNSTLNGKAGFLNTSDDSQFGEGFSTLYLGPIDDEEGPGSAGPTPPSTATIVGGFLNTATTTNGGFATSLVSVNGGSALNVDTMTNTATSNTALGFDNSAAQILLSSGSTLSVLGALTNGTYILNSNGYAAAFIGADGSSTLTVGGGVTNYNSTLALTNSSTLSVTAGGFANTADDNNNLSFYQGYSTLSLDNSTGSIVGGLNNSATTTLGGQATATVSLTNGSQLTVDSLTNSATSNTVGGGDVAVAQVNLSGTGTLLTVTGDVNNISQLGTGPLGTASAGINLDAGSSLTVGGVFNNIQSSLFLTNGSTATVTGLFTNSGRVSLDNTGAGTSVLTTKGGFVNSQQVDLNNSSKLANTGTFSNSGTVTLANASTLSTTSLVNTGTLTTQGSGLNAVNATGAVFNTSPGVINLNGAGDKMTALGQFTNSGTVNLGGTGASVTSAGLDNQSGGNLNLTVDGNSVASTAAASNEGTIAFIGTNGTVSSTGDFTNASTGVVSMAGSGDTFSSQGTIFNSGAVTIGANEDVSAADYTQLTGTTTLETGGTLTAALADFTGGLLTGGGTVVGNLTIDGGTLNPGDPQSISVIGNYDQTMLGILDLDLAGQGAGNYDQVNVTGGDDSTAGNVTLGGTLDLDLEPGFDAAFDITAGTVFDVMNWTGTETGNFSTFNDQTFDNGSLTFQEVLNGNELDLVVVDTAATPEPSTLSMLLCAALIGSGITWTVRRRTNVVK